MAMAEHQAQAIFEPVQADGSWKLPEYFNIAVAVCDRWADEKPDSTAIISVESGGDRHTSFSELRTLSNRMANLLLDCGSNPGDRISVLLEQSLEVAISHIAIYKTACIAVPLFNLFGQDAISYRLNDSGARIVITNQLKARELIAHRHRLPRLEHIIVVDGPCESCIDWASNNKTWSSEFQPAKTKADDPALIIYTSGTTGQPKGAVHAHRVLLGHLPGVAMSHNGFPHQADIIWTPADWAWIGGLLDVLLPALYFAVPVVAYRFPKFDVEAAYELIARIGVRNLFLPPTALRAMSLVTDADQRWSLNVRSIASGGEPLGTQLQKFCEQTFKLQVNEFYGQTECNMIVSSCNAVFENRPPFIGKAVPGHDVNIIDEHGKVLKPGEAGQIAVRAPDPVMLLNYWNRPDATAEKFLGNWLLTGDMAEMDEDGYIRFIGRDDDIITSAGYRIGPAEIENCLDAHPAVYRSAVIGKPDARRTEIVKAFIVLADTFDASSELTKALQLHVKKRLAAHEYPREIDYVNALPMTTTGKIIRKALRDREQ
jgi:acetyl-CoA synthetase